MQHPTNELVAFDTETYLIRDGLIAPPMVCLSWADGAGNLALLGREDALAWWRHNIKRRELSWAGHNLAYDMVVMANECPDTLPHIFMAYLEGRVHDTMLREALLKNAAGTYSNKNEGLALLTKRYLNRDRSEEKKGVDAWRLRYAELVDIPVADWPAAARNYALDDAADTLKVVLAQARANGWVFASGAKTNQVLPDGSIVDEKAQCRAALALQLMSTYGLLVDQEAAQTLEESYRDEANRLMLKLIARGIKDKSGKTHTKVVRDLIIAALTRAATDEQREAAHQLTVDARREFEAGEARAVAAEEKARPGSWTATRQHVARVAAWGSLGFTMPTSATGRIKTGEEILETIEDEDIELLVEWTGADKRLSTYLEPMTSSTGHALCPSYDVLKRSGRTSSYNPNIQNFPRSGGERECFIPREGFLYVAADYSTVELRAWAQVCLDLGIPSEMAAALQAGLDLHTDLGAQLACVTYETMQRALKGEEPTLPKARAKLFRGAAKPANFGLPVGMGASKFEESARKSYGVDFDDLGVTAQEVRDVWYERWTEAYPYFAHVKALLYGTGEYDTVEGEDGETYEREVMKCDIRHPRSGRVRGGCFFTDAANSYFQGMAADGAKEALFRVALECYADPSSPLFGSRPVAFIHDEIIIEAPGDRVQGAAARLSEVMIEAMAVYIPDIPILCEADIMDRWAKAAESERLDDGTLSIYIHGEDRQKALRRAGVLK